VAYRDHCDGPLRIEALPCQPSVSAFAAFLDRIKATGGGDEPEDVLGGIEEAVRLVGFPAGLCTLIRKSNSCCLGSMDWEILGPNTARLLFHIADSPCHGVDYHDGYADDHPTGDPRGLSASV
jgi:hypothetical protein